jgi:hypothetical protein
MKKMISLCAVLLCMGIAMAQTNFYQNSSYISDSGAKPEVKTVLNYDKNLIMGYTITFNYDAKDIETAVTERLEKEGVEGSKKKNFYAYKGIKYNHIWNKMFDMYIQFVGSKNAGTINVILSQGYDNFIIPTEDSITTSKMYAWLTSLDLDVQNYQYNLAMQAHQEEHKDIKKELAKLEKQQTKIEKKIKKNADAQAKFDASKTIVFSNGKIACILTKEQTHCLNLLTKKVRESFIPIKIERNGKQVNALISVVSNKPKIKLSIENGAPRLSVDLTLICEKEETYAHENVSELAKANKVSNEGLTALEKQISDDIARLIGISIETNCDFLQLNELLYKHNSKHFFELKDSLLSKLEYKISVTCKNYR